MEHTKLTETRLGKMEQDAKNSYTYKLACLTKVHVMSRAYPTGRCCQIEPAARDLEAGRAGIF